MKNVSFSFCLILLLSLASCQDKLEEWDNYHLQPERLAELAPLQVGKYITYRLDSTVFTELGLVREVHSYQEKNLVDAAITDASGRPSYRVYRFLRDEAGTESWRSAGTYFITNTGKQIEWVENNRRVVKLVLPVSEGTTWRGNRFLPAEPFAPEIINFSISNDIQLWDFIYSAEQNEAVGDFQLNEVRTVFHDDESTNVDAQEQVMTAESYASRSRSVEKWAKGIGLVYQNLILWEYQPEMNSNTSYKGRYKGFGVERTLIDHN